MTTSAIVGNVVQLWPAFLIRQVFGALLLVCSLLGHAGQPIGDGESPKVQALLEQGWMAESGTGLQRDLGLAAGLYRQAGQMGSGEGYFRAALLYMPPPKKSVGTGLAACYLAAASQLGHRGAAEILDASAIRLADHLNCDHDVTLPAALPHFDMERYVDGLSNGRKRIVHLIRRLAPRYALDSRLVVAMASVESNFNAGAISPKAAMGVMQLIPATAERFGVVDPFDPEQNIRGGLAYLRWLKQYYKGDVVRMIAAYNAGEGAVDAHRGIPPYAETVAYVARVLHFSGLGLQLLPPTGAGESTVEAVNYLVKASNRR